MLIEENKLLAPFTTFSIGGPARWFVQAASEEEIVEATAWAEERRAPLFVLGGGSNLLISDAGFDGLVLRVGLRGISLAAAPNSVSCKPLLMSAYPAAASACRRTDSQTLLRTSVYCGDSTTASRLSVCSKAIV